MEQWFSEGLIKWYKANKRDLPWRNESDPYRIWLSEIILQQTQVKQGLSYYLKFVKNYPTVKHLAKANEDSVMKDWQGLGYYSRARNMHAAAKSIVENYGGKFPQSFDEIKKLKGVGHYTAAAIASFAFNLPQAVVDGNVYRVLSRIFGIKEFIDTTQGKKTFQDLADELLNKKNPAAHNQAIMEFGSQYCKPVNPACTACIFKANCIAFSKKQVAELPLKSKKTKVSERYFNYLVVADKHKSILLNKRSGSDIWKGLYDFLLVETDKPTEPEKLLMLNDSREITGKKFAVVHVSKMYRHVLTHRILHARFLVIKKDAVHPKNDLNAKADALIKFAFPRLIEKFMEDCNLNELL
jgi:A/G-specific adenine glycosylase